MELYHICPINHLELTKSGRLYLLASDLYTSEEYKNFALSSKQFKTIDLNVHEGDNKINWDTYIDIFLKCKADEIIVPDVLDNATETFKNFINFKNLYRAQLKGKYIMTVPQGKTIAEIETLFSTFENDDWITTIGVSFTLTPFQFSKDKYINQMLNRLFLVDKIINEWKITKPLHLLGNNSVYELLLLKHYKQIRSNDGKLACRCALNKVLFNDDYGCITKPVKKIYMDTILDNEQLILAEKNIEIMNKILR